MKDIQIFVIGGCHVVGYPLGISHAFPTLLCSLNDAEIVGQISNVQFLRLDEFLVRISESQPSHVVLQMGNFEFSASFYHLLRQFKRVFGLTVLPMSDSSSSSSSSHTNTVDVLPAKGAVDAFMRVMGLGVFTVGTWLLSGRHRRTFQVLNKFIAKNNNIDFYFLSPLPCLDPPANTLRRLGGWLLRRGIDKQSNYYWLDTHQVIPVDSHFFADPSHLSDAGHQALAHLLADAFHERGGTGQGLVEHWEQQSEVSNHA